MHPLCVGIHKKDVSMFDLEVENHSMTQVRHIKSGATIVIWNGTNKYDLAPSFDSDAPINVDDHPAVEALVGKARNWIAERSLGITRRQRQRSKRS
jgi:hypothetical protein